MPTPPPSGASPCLPVAERSPVEHSSVVGTELLAESAYFRAKIRQESLIRAGSVPFTIVHGTQFFEFVGGIADEATVETVIHLAPVHIQPIASGDVAAAVVRAILGEPVGGVVEVAGPDAFRLDDLVQRHLTAHGDARGIVLDPGSRYFGAVLGDRTLVPNDGARLAATHYETWLASQVA